MVSQMRRLSAAVPNWMGVIEQLSLLPNRASEVYDRDGWRGFYRRQAQYLQVLLNEKQACFKYADESEELAAIKQLLQEET